MPEVSADPSLVFLEIGTLLFVAAGAGAVSRRIGLPAVVGYLTVGLAVGPFTPGFVVDPVRVQLLANIGAVLLLFEVGLDTDVRGLLRVGPLLLSVVVGQVLVTIATTIGILTASGSSVASAAVIGLALATSSTVVAVNITRSRRRTIDDASGRVMVLWSVVQDLLTIPAIAILGAMVGGGPDLDLALALAKAALFVAVAAVVGTAILPPVLHRVAGERDTFLVMVVATAIVTAGIGALVFGVPLALAAFIVGLAIRYRRESGEARREILPFRDLFAILFFVAVGTLIDPAALLRDTVWILIAALVGLKGLTVWALARTTRAAPRPLQISVGLSQIGEFSFVVLSLGLAVGTIDRGQYSAVLAVAVASIAISTIAARWPGPRARTA